MVRLETAISRVYDKVNIQGEDGDIDSAMQSFKAIRLLNRFDYERVYNDLSFRLGYQTKTQYENRLCEINKEEVAICQYC